MDKDGGGGGDCDDGDCGDGGDVGGDGGDDVRTLCHHDEKKVSTDPTELTLACCNTGCLRTPTWYRLDKKKHSWVIYATTCSKLVHS